MSNKMIAFWILLILSAFHVALAAPVAVGEILEVRSNAVDVLRGRMAAWEKRMDSDNEDHWSTNQAHRNPEDDNLGSDLDSNDGPGGHNEEDMLGSKSGSEMPWRHSKEAESDARGPDRYYNTGYLDSDADFYYDSEDGLYYNYDKGDDAKSDDSNDSAKSDDSNDGNGDDNGYDGDYEYDDSDRSHSDYGNFDDSDDSDDTMQSGQESAENTSSGPKSEHTATPEHMTDFEKILKGSLRSIRPRNWRRCGYAKEGAAGTVDYGVRL